MSPREAAKVLKARKDHIDARATEVEAKGGVANYDRSESDAIVLAIIALDGWSTMNRARSEREGRVQRAPQGEIL